MIAADLAVIDYLLQAPVAPTRITVFSEKETMVSLMVAARSLALAPPLDPHVHMALGGLLAQVHVLLEEIAPLWQKADARVREWWLRDRQVLDVADTPRRRRLNAARSHYDGT